MQLTLPRSDICHLIYTFEWQSVEEASDCSQMFDYDFFVCQMWH